MNGTTQAERRGDELAADAPPPAGPVVPRPIDNPDPRHARDDVLEHVKMIQGITAKLGGYAVPLRPAAFALTAVATTVAVAGHAVIAWPAAAAVLGAMCLDGYFLRQRRLFRRLATAVTRGVVPWLAMDLGPYRADCRYWRAVVNATVLGLYGPLVLVLAVAGLAGAR